MKNYEISKVLEDYANSLRDFLQFLAFPTKHNKFYSTHITPPPPLLHSTQSYNLHLRFEGFFYMFLFGIKSTHYKRKRN